MVKIDFSEDKKNDSWKYNIDKLKNLVELADIIDVSGALETNKVKDINKIKKFTNEIKKISDEN